MAVRVPLALPADLEQRLIAHAVVNALDPAELLIESVAIRLEALEGKRRHAGRWWLGLSPRRPGAGPGTLEPVLDESWPRWRVEPVPEEDEVSAEAASGGRSRLAHIERDDDARALVEWRPASSEARFYLGAAGRFASAEVDLVPGDVLVNLAPDAWHRVLAALDDAADRLADSADEEGGED